jgi:hypothetical protein
MLTNDSAYWKVPGRIDTIDAAFRIHDGQVLQGTVGRGPMTGKGTVLKREAPLELSGRIDLKWRDYSLVGTGDYPRFRYLAAEASLLNAPST